MDYELYFKVLIENKNIKFQSLQYCLIMKKNDFNKKIKIKKYVQRKLTKCKIIFKLNKKTCISSILCEILLCISTVKKHF